MTLRSYSADSVARYSWVDGKLEAAPVNLHALGVFIPQSVTLIKNNLLAIEGSTLIVDSKTGQPKQAGQSFMKIEVDLHGADPAVVLPKIQEMLFFPDLAQAIAALPESLAPCPFIPAGHQQKKMITTIFLMQGIGSRSKSIPHNLATRFLSTVS